MSYLLMEEKRNDSSQISSLILVKSCQRKREALLSIHIIRFGDLANHLGMTAKRSFVDILKQLWGSNQSFAFKLGNVNIF